MPTLIGYHDGCRHAGRGRLTECSTKDDLMSDGFYETCQFPVLVSFFAQERVPLELSFAEIFIIEFEQRFERSVQYAYNCGNG